MATTRRNAKDKSHGTPRRTRCFRPPCSAARRRGTATARRPEPAANAADASAAAHQACSAARRRGTATAIGTAQATRTSPAASTKPHDTAAHRAPDDAAASAANLLSATAPEQETPQATALALGNRGVSGHRLVASHHRVGRRHPSPTGRKHRTHLRAEHEHQPRPRRHRRHANRHRAHQARRGARRRSRSHRAGGAFGLAR